MIVFKFFFNVLIIFIFGLTKLATEISIQKSMGTTIAGDTHLQ